MGKFDGILLCSDFDGTFASNGVPIEANMKAIKYFRENGGLFTLASGRNYEFLTHRIAAWSPAPPRDPTNHSPSPQRSTNWLSVMLRQFSAESASAVATTNEDELESPAATGIVPSTITSIPQRLKSKASRNL